MFESIFTSTAQDTISIGPAMLGLLTALVLGLLIGIAYMIACKKDGYNKNFIIGLVLLPAIVSVVILLIGSNVARAYRRRIFHHGSRTCLRTRICCICSHICSCDYTCFNRTFCLKLRRYGIRKPPVKDYNPGELKLYRCV